MEDVHPVFCGMIAETHFRESPPADLDTYLTIRKQTIGITPFYTLVEGFLNTEFSLSQNTEILEDMKELLSEILGLENDLIGLEKDLRTGETMNALFVLKGQQMAMLDDRVDGEEVLRDCVMHVEEMIGRAVKRLMGMWIVMEGGVVEGWEREFYESMMRTTETIMRWLLAAQRYKGA